jgi:hypothetical protein
MISSDLSLLIICKILEEKFLLKLNPNNLMVRFLPGKCLQSYAPATAIPSTKVLFHLLKELGLPCAKTKILEIFKKQLKITRESWIVKLVQIKRRIRSSITII